MHCEEPGHAGIVMDSLVTEELREFVMRMLHLDGVRGTKEWKDLNPLQLGILSWHLGNFYLPGWWEMEEGRFHAQTSDLMDG